MPHMCLRQELCSSFRAALVIDEFCLKQSRLTNITWILRNAHKGWRPSCNNSVAMNEDTALSTTFWFEGQLKWLWEWNLAYLLRWMWHECKVTDEYIGVCVFGEKILVIHLIYFHQWKLFNVKHRNEWHYRNNSCRFMQSLWRTTHLATIAVIRVT